MGFNLTTSEKGYLNENQSWLGKAHGTEECDSITLDADKFLAAFPTGIVPSGVLLGKITASGLYAPYTDAETHGAGTGVARGHLFTTVDLKGTTAAAARDTVAALFWHGQVIEAKLPTGHGLDAAAKADLTQIRYV
ncbi:MAG: head decoration protein [Actinomycetota bacterium]